MSCSRLCKLSAWQHCRRGRNAVHPSSLVARCSMHFSFFSLQHRLARKLSLRTGRLATLTPRERERERVVITYRKSSLQSSLIEESERQPLLAAVGWMFQREWNSACQCVDIRIQIIIIKPTLSEVHSDQDCIQFALFTIFMHQKVQWRLDLLVLQHGIEIWAAYV